MRLPLSSVCNPEHWNDRFWRRCLDSMAFRASFGVIGPEIQHRKVWEWVQGLAALARLGCLRPSAHALGVAAGHEPPIYWLASRVAQVYATDLYSGVFVGHEASPDVLRDPDKYAPYPYPRERVRFLPMSGTHICFGDQTIDFVFSFCSIEHFGSRANSRRALQEMARVLRPGGVAVVSTEVLLNDVAPQPEIFSPWELYEELVAPSGLLLIGDIAPANLAPYCADPVDTSDPASTAASRPHFVLRAEEALFTSVMMVLQKV
jgi:SAM-dependent methyltransferase